jgi:hypothetical protein
VPSKAAARSTAEQTALVTERKAFPNGVVLDVYEPA